jgi:hypothetical protein
MNRPETRFDIRKTEYGHSSIRPTVIRRLLVLCAAGAITLLLVAESRVSSGQRQQAFEVSGVYP